MGRIAGALLVAFLVARCASAGDASASPRHLIYVHGRIVQEQQSLRPRHPQHGYYELEQIASALRDRRFVVSAEMRPKGTTVEQGADRLVEQVQSLLDAGVPADHINILGASMGASISLRASARLQNPNIHFALLGPCLSSSIPAVAAEEGMHPSGNLFVVRDESDVPSAGCEAWSDETKRADGLRAREIVINTGLGHGYLYRPMPEWLEPVTRWMLSD